MRRDKAFSRRRTAFNAPFSPHRGFVNLAANDDATVKGKEKAVGLEQSPELQLAVQAVRTAAAVCRGVQQSITQDVLEKKDRSPVTVADFASQAVVCRALAGKFPEAMIIAEEDSAELRHEENASFLDRISEELQRVDIAGSTEEICSWIDLGNGNPDAMRYWTLDPIDGTKGFLRGDQYAVSLALLQEGEIQLGAVACPNLGLDGIRAGEDEAAGVILFASKGQGAWQVPMDDPNAEPRRIRVSTQTDAAAARFCESFESKHSAHSQSAQVAEKLGIQADPVRIDSQAKYAAVARGDAEIYLRLPTRPGYVERIWDHAGGAIVVQEAGGRVSDVDGNPLDWTHGKGLKANRGVIVTNGPFHEAILSALRELNV